jgi:uncharacterized protein
MATFEVVDSLAGIDAASWDACANADRQRNPFVSHAFLSALEHSGCVDGRSGWASAHVLMKDSDSKLLAAAPAYLKSHSQGEYVFDHGWADAYERAGGNYYPKLQVAAPFSPVPGPRLLVRNGPDAERNRFELAKALMAATGQLSASSCHVTFAQQADREALEKTGFLLRQDLQFHWRNNGYAAFDEFLDALASRKRKAIRKERESVRTAGITIKRLSGKDITAADWQSFYAFYLDTSSRKWGRPYLNRAFFERIGETMADQIVLVIAYREGRAIAGAINLLARDRLFGRNWGCIEQHPCLHFEVCYYQAIECAIERKLAVVEAGAQGEHKLARGYLPVTTYSAHWIAHPGLRSAVANFLERERVAVAHAIETYAEESPFKQTEKASASFG